MANYKLTHTGQEVNQAITDVGTLKSDVSNLNTRTDTAIDLINELNLAWYQGDLAGALTELESHLQEIQKMTTGNGFKITFENEHNELVTYELQINGVVTDINSWKKINDRLTNTEIDTILPNFIKK